MQPSLKQTLLRGAVRFLTRAARRVNRHLAMLDYKLTGGVSAEGRHGAAVLRSTLSHDMYADADEGYYREQYWHWIERALTRLPGGNAAMGLDLGCGQGRLTVLLGRVLVHGRVIGTDISEPAIAAARKYSEVEGVRNVEYRASPIRETLLACATESVDVVLMIEVTFFHPHWRRDLDEINRVIRPGGIICIAFRPQYFNALCIVRDGLPEQTRMLLDERRGNLFGGDVVFTWQTSSEVRRLLRDELGWDLLELVGIGCCSGIGGDPHAQIARPSKLDLEGRRDLMRLELSMGAEVPDAGRYMLAIASKRVAG